MPIADRTAKHCIKKVQVNHGGGANLDRDTVALCITSLDACAPVPRAGDANAVTGLVRYVDATSLTCLMHGRLAVNYMRGIIIIAAVNDK